VRSTGSGGRRIGLWSGAAAMAVTLGCSMAGQYVHTTGACSDERTGCEARCERLTDKRDCMAGCLLDARMCMRAQGDTAPMVGDGPVRISEDKALLVDLFGPRPKHSPELSVELGGDVQPIEAAHQFGPGGRIGVTFTLPADIREAEIALAHGPVGDGTGCFVTITLGEKTLAGRYAPPRTQDGRLAVETWNLTPLLNEMSPEDRAKPQTLFIFNNDAAGSTQPYRLATIQFFYKTLTLQQPARERPGNRAFTAPQ